MNAVGTPASRPPRVWTEDEKSLMVKQAGEREQQACIHGNQQVDARILSADVRMSDEEIALAVKHAEERAALDFGVQAEGSELQYRHTCAKDELVTRQRSEKAALKKK